MLRDPDPQPETTGVVLTCGDPTCRHTFTPHPQALAGSLACPRCAGWTFTATRPDTTDLGGGADHD